MTGDHTNYTLHCELILIVLIPMIKIIGWNYYQKCAAHSKEGRKSAVHERN